MKIVRTGKLFYYINIHFTHCRLNEYDWCIPECQVKSVYLSVLQTSQVKHYQ